MNEIFEGLVKAQIEQVKVELPGESVHTKEEY